MAVESGDAEDVGTTTLRVGIKASRADRGESASSEEGEHRELHFESGWKCWYFHKLLVNV